MAVTGQDVIDGCRRLGVAGAPMAIHVSLRSFGGFDGGPATLDRIR